MGIIMLCATAWQRALITEEKRRSHIRPTIHVTDEAWMALALSKEAEAARERTKLSVTTTWRRCNCCTNWPT